MTQSQQHITNPEDGFNVDVPVMGTSLAPPRALAMIRTVLGAVERQRAKPRKDMPRAAPSDSLLTPAEAARKLRCSIKTLNGHVASARAALCRRRPWQKARAAHVHRFRHQRIHRRQDSKGRCLSPYKPKDGRSPYFHYDFQVRGHRFHGSTKCTARREAEKVEAAEREKAKRLVTQLAAAKTSLRLDDVADRYWNEVGQHQAGADNIDHELALLIEFLSKDRLVTDITDDDVALLVAWRRGHRRKDGALISPYTVNHTTKQLRKLFTRCKLWGVRFDHEPKWSKHLLKVPAERVRELSDDEADKLDAVMRGDLAPFFDFARASGLRLKECVTLRWSEVKWPTVHGERGQIVKLGKGGERVTKPISSEIRDILWPLSGHHHEFVFTFVADRTVDGRVKGKRYPLTYVGVQSYWKRLRRQSGVTGFRIHDYRHDFATKLLRVTGNLKLVQEALNHKDIKTTMRYAHVLDEEIAEGMERVAESRNRSRSCLREVS